MLKTLEKLQRGAIIDAGYAAEVASQRMVNLMRGGKITLPLAETGGITALDLDRIQDRFLLCGAKNGAIAIYDRANPCTIASDNSGLVAHLRPSRDTHEYTIVRVQWYPFDTGIFTTSCKCKHLKIWDTLQLKAVDVISMDCHINSHDVAALSDRRHLIAVALTEDPFVVIYDVRSGSSTHRLIGHRNSAGCVKWSPMSEYLLASGGSDKRILLWDIRSARSYLKCLDQHNSDSFVGTNDFSTSHNEAVTALKFTNDGLYLVSQDIDRNLKLWDVALAKNTLVNYGPMPRRIQRCHLPFAIDICSASTRPILFAPVGKNVKVYDLHSGTQLKILTGHLQMVYACVFRSSTQELYSSGKDTSILFWSPGGANVPEGKPSNRYCTK